MSTNNHRVEQAMLMWQQLIPAPAPSESQFLIWLSGHTDETVLLGLEAAAKAFHRLHSQDRLILYASKAMNNRTRILKLMKEKEDTQCQNKLTSPRFQDPKLKSFFPGPVDLNQIAERPLKR
jgi:hypothetical protein